MKCDPALREARPEWKPSYASLRLDDIECPIVLARGAASALFPYRSALEIAQRLPNAELRSIPMAGHAVMLDTPRAVAATIHAAMERLLPP